MKKRLFALLMTLVMVMGLFAGCGGTKDKGNISLKPVDKDGNVIEGDKPWSGYTVSMAFYSNYDIKANAWLFEKIKEATGIIIEPICYTSSVYFEKLGGWIATRDLPDLFTSGNLEKSEIDMYGAQGALVNLNDPEVLELIPSFKEIYIDNAENNARYSQYFTEDGAMYTIPVYDMSRDVNHCMMYREDVFKELNIEPWTDTESFLAALRALKKAYPDSYPFTGSDFFQTLGRMGYSFDTNELGFAYDYDTNKWYSGVTSNEFRELADLLQTMFKEGLIDPDIFTNTSAEVDAMMLNNKSFVTHNWIGRMAVENPAGQKQDADFRIIPGNAIGTGKYIELEKFDGGGGLHITNGPNQGAALAVVEWLFSEEGSYIASVGVEGDNYEVVDGKITYPAIEATLDEGEIVTYQNLTETYGMWIDGYYVRTSRDAIYYDYTAEEQAAQELGNAAGYYDAAPPMRVPSSYTYQWADAEDSYTKDYEAFLTDYICKNYGDTEWNKFVSDINAEYAWMFNVLNGN